MHLQLTIPFEEIQKAILQATPIRIHMTTPDGPERWVELDEPREMQLIPDVGVQLSMRGRFHFEIAKVPLQDEIAKVRVTLKPEIEVHDTGVPTLALHIDLHETDLATMPDLIDRGVMKIVDRALKPAETQMRLPYGKMLSVEGPVSPRMQPLSKARTSVTDSSLIIRADALVFGVDLALELINEGTVGEKPPE